MTIARRDRRASTAAATTPAAGLDDPAAVADAVTRLAVALPLDYNDMLTNITKLLVVTPLNKSHMDEIVKAIIRSALADPFFETTANRWRPLLPEWVRRGSMNGATVNVLLNMGVLVSTGRYVRCDDTTSRNTNKFQPVHALDVIALRDLLSHSADAAMSAETA